MVEPRSATRIPAGEPSADDDLATRPAGHLARQRARHVRRSGPVRTVLARMVGVHTEERAWRLGARGEELVGAQLDKLAARDPRWRFLHSVPVGRDSADVDHIVIGPGGVFTLNAKHHPDARIWVAGRTFLVNGVHQPYLRNSRHEATRAERLLTRTCGFPITVTGVVVPVNARDVVVKRAPEDVHVVSRRRLRRWLRRRDEVLDEPTVDRIYEAARRGSTWR